MPTVLHGLRKLDQTKVRFVISPLVELGSALHVVADPSHHVEGELLRTSLSLSLRPAKLARLDSWLWTVSAVRGRIFLNTEFGGRATWADEVDRLRQRDPASVAADLLRPLQGRAQDLARVPHWARSRGPDVADLVDRLMTEPRADVAEFVELLDECWRRWFAPVWERSRTLLVARARHDRDVAARDGVATMLRSLHPSIDTRSGSDSVVIEKVQNKRLDVGSRGLVLCPSALVAPHVYVADAPGKPVLVIYPCDSGNPPAGPTVPSVRVLKRRLDAMAGEGRLEVCRAVASEPRTAGEIATLWQMNPTQVTRHLTALTHAGIVTKERRGRFVCYRLDDSAVRCLGGDVLAAILR